MNITRKYKPLDLKFVLNTASIITGISLKKIKMGRVIGNSEVTAKIDTAIEIFVKYVLDNNIDNYDRKTIAATFNGYETKITTLSKKFELNGLSTKNQFLYNELCRQIENNEKK